MKKFLQIAHRDERGVALILTLAILVLVTLLVVGFAINMRVETAISKNYTEQVRARQFALAAVDEAVALLRLATPPISITTNWASGPGMIFMRTGSGSYTNIPLCSLDDSGDEPFDINYRRLRRIMRTDNTNLFVGWKRWVLPNQPTTGRDNLIGRYCYWIDDEASKININTARRRPASPNPPTYTPEDIDLRDLNRVTGGVFDSETAANLSYQFGTNTGYASPNSWSVIDPNNVSFALFCHSNHFRTTTFSQDTSLTPWGAPRMNLNTNILTTNPQQYLLAITNMLGNAHLNGWFGQTFRDKYGNNLLQIAANIKDYVDVDNIPTDSGGYPPTYLGLERTPYMNELVISNSFIVSVNTNWLIIERRTTTLMELWYMYPPPAPDYDLSGHTVTIANRPTITFNWDPAPATLPSPVVLNGTGVITPSPWSGSYQVLAQSDTPVITSNIADNVFLIFNAGTVTAEFRGPGGRLDYASIRMTNHFNVRLGKDMNGRTTNMSWVSACRDPRVRPVSHYWNPVGGGMGPQTFRSGTMGAWNSGSVWYWVTNPVPGTTAQLLSDGGLVERTTEYSCHTNISNRGTFESVGELHFIHTGVPWRTLALRPQHTLEKVQNLLPDWAVLDLFCTHDKLAGRININSQVYTGQGLHVRATLQREIPIRALYYPDLARTFTGVGRVSSNIQNHVWNLTHAYQPPTTWAPFTTDAFGWIGQVCEVMGMTSNNVAKEVSERGIRSIANLITTRSNAFSIWAVGQTIADVNRDGRYNAADGDEINSEILVHVVVERYENTAVTGPNRIRYRTRFFQYY